MTFSSPRIPNLSLQPAAVDFIENRFDAYHPAFATPPSRYDPSLGIFVIYDSQTGPSPSPPPTTMHSARAWAATQSPVAGGYTVPPRPLAKPISALNFWDSLFRRAMDEFTKAHPDEPSEIIKKGSRIRDKSDWTAVFNQLESAKHDYCNVNKGFKARFRKVYRNVGDFAQPILGATKFVPDIDYVTPVLGAVQILLEAIKIATKVRSEILSAFEDIDMKFSQVEMFLEIFSDDENIKGASVKLIAAVFYAVECAIGFFLKSTWKKALSATFTAEEYQQNIRDGLTAVNSQSSTLIQEAELSDKYVMHSEMKKIIAVTSQWKYELNVISQQTERIHRGQKVMAHDLKTGFNFLLQEYELSRREDQAKYQSLNRTIGLLATQVSELSRPSSPALSGHHVATPQYFDPREILGWINIPDLASGDLKYMNEKRSMRVSENEQAGAEQLIQTSQFQKWLLAPASSQLLVHGSYNAGMQRFSGLSLFCASFIGALSERAPRFVQVMFFCGLHEDPDLADDYTGGRAIIQSFIRQLLSQHDYRGTISVSQVSKKLIRSGNVEELCALFKFLVRRLPEYITLVCIIDGAVYYERPWFQYDMGLVMVTILQMSEEASTQAVVKVLVTSPTATKDIRQPFPDELILSMEAMAESGLVASKSRLERQLKEELNLSDEDESE